MKKLKGDKLRFFTTDSGLYKPINPKSPLVYLSVISAGGYIWYIIPLQMKTQFISPDKKLKKIPSKWKNLRSLYIGCNKKFK